MSIHAKLSELQYKLVAPKGQYNSFGKYRYRNCEDILEAVKPLLHELKCTLTLADEVVSAGDRYYIKATATLTDIENGETLSTTAYAREEAEKKGMDGSQITGASSSYARKYCLCGLLCIDDNKDSDTTDNTSKGDDIGLREVKCSIQVYAEFEKKKAKFEKYVKEGKIKQSSLDNLNNAEKAAWQSPNADEAYREIIKSMNKNLEDAEKA